MSAALDGQLEAYLAAVGRLGGAIEATDAGGKALALGAATSRAVAMADATKRAGTRVLFVGNGGSAAIASHMATDWMKNGGFASAAFNDGAALTCLGNDLGYDQVFARQLQAHARAGDLLIAISSSGNSANILNAVTAARGRRCDVITLSGFQPDNKLRSRGDLNFWVPSPLYGFVELSHLAICSAIFDLAMGWRAEGKAPDYFTVEPVR
jgi:D-sedoheptulose 7-phosphate isomerase